MGSKMTSWTLNLALAGMVAAFFTLPNPGEIRQAIEYGQSRLQIEAAQVEAAVVESQAVRSLSYPDYGVTNSSSFSCLQNYQEQVELGVMDCLPILVSQITRYDEAAKLRVNDGRKVFPNPEIESMRLAVANLCRVKWSAQTQQDVGPNLEQCRSVMQGIAY